MAGLAAARARGRTGGRPRLMTRAKRRTAMAAMADQGDAAADVAARPGISTSTLYAYVDGKGARSAGRAPASRPRRNRQVSSRSGAAVAVAAAAVAVAAPTGRRGHRLAPVGSRVINGQDTTLPLPAASAHG